jgi:hypothetical protein
LAVTISQKPSVAQSAQTVPWALTPDTRETIEMPANNMSVVFSSGTA